MMAPATPPDDSVETAVAKRASSGQCATSLKATQLNVRIHSSVTMKESKDNLEARHPPRRCVHLGVVVHAEA
jgi:hypothetical protein